MAATEKCVAHEYRSFGPELRRRRLEANFTLTKLASLVHYSKAHLSKVERGLKEPSLELVRLCDAELQAQGELAALADQSDAKNEHPEPSSSNSPWPERVSGTGSVHNRARVRLQ